MYVCVFIYLFVYLFWLAFLIFPIGFFGSNFISGNNVERIQLTADARFYQSISCRLLAKWNSISLSYGNNRSIYSTCIDATGYAAIVKKKQHQLDIFNRV